MGVHIVMGGLIQIFIQPNMARLMDDVRMGTLDYVLTKPADSQVLVSIREVRIWSIVDVVTGRSSSASPSPNSIVRSASGMPPGLFSHSSWGQ